MLLDIEQIKQSIKRLSPAELAELGQFIQQEQEESEPILIHSKLSAQEKLRILREVRETFWDGLTEDEINEAVEAISRKIPSVEDYELFAWIDELPEHER